MKIKTPLMIVSALFFSVNQGNVFADKAPLESEIETPDTLLQTANPDKEKTSYGEENIVISGDGAKDNDITKPDLLLNTVGKKTKSSAKDIKLQPRKISEADKAIETDDPLLKATRKKEPVDKNKALHEKHNHNELETPDPLLDSMN
ncbi:hypothetical protein MNBD_GAMMA08-2218 [hydrothermal vent metagenome]|uniref:Uncharacterized protein n=1 Tax=hydrothermal vent metagenome TaxID=652676 RepID=A0A3B0XEH9_9ZZZZ